MEAMTNVAALWWIAIGVGVVVVLCVIVLLSLLSAFVGDIDRNVDTVARHILRVKDNTATSPHLHHTAALIEALGVELAAHEHALSTRTGPL